MDFWQAVTVCALFIGIISSIVAVIGFFVDVRQLKHKHRILLISIPLAIVLLAGGGASLLYHPLSSSASNTHKSSAKGLSSIPNSTPTDTPTTQPALQPTDTPTTQPTDTLTALATPSLATAGPSKSIRLGCTCSDPVLVTITKIIIQPQQNRMLWSLTLQNVSPNNANITFTQFYLQQGNLIDNPTSNGQMYPAAGGAVNNSVPLQPSDQPGAIQTTTLTFLFMPFATSYTLTSALEPCSGFCGTVTLDPTVITFS